MITFNQVQKQFGSRVIFKDCSLQIGVRDRVGLIGPNGSGKTTLFRMILGEESVDEGEILIAKGVKLGYLPQEVITFRGNTVLDEVLRSLTNITSLQDKMKLLEEELSSMEDPNPPGVCRRMRISCACSAYARDMLLTMYSAVIGSIVPCTSMRAMSAWANDAAARNNPRQKMAERIREVIRILVSYSVLMITHINRSGFKDRKELFVLQEHRAQTAGIRRGIGRVPASLHGKRIAPGARIRRRKIRAKGQCCAFH